MDVLDLAPGSRWRINPSHGFNGLAIDDRRVSYEEVTDLQAEEGQRDPNAALQEMLQTLTNTPNNERQAVARLMMNEMRSGERPSNRQTMLLMTLIANGPSMINTVESMTRTPGSNMLTPASAAIFSPRWVRLIRKTSD